MNDVPNKQRGLWVHLRVQKQQAYNLAEGGSVSVRVQDALGNMGSHLLRESQVEEEIVRLRKHYVASTYFIPSEDSVNVNVTWK